MTTAAVDALRLSACPGCGSKDLTVLDAEHDHRIFVTDGEEFTFRIGGSGCRDCGLIFLNPRAGPLTLQAYYAKQSRIPRAKTSPGEPFVSLLDMQATLIARYKKPAPGMRLLEIGCAEGFFLERLNRDANGKAKLFAVEPSARYAANARELLPGAEIYETVLEKAPLEPASFDLITIRHVLEHIQDPLDGLRRLRAALKPDGALHVEVPDCEELLPTISPFFGPEHLTYFTRETLGRAFAAAGLKPLCLEPGRDNPPYSGFHYPVLRCVVVPGPAHAPTGRVDTERIYAHNDQLRRDFLARHMEPAKKRVQELRRAGRRLALFGAGPHTMYLLECLGLSDSIWSVAFDNNPNKSGKRIRGVVIARPTAEAFKAVDAVLISSAEYEGEMVEQIQELAPDLEIITVYREKA